MRDQALAGSDAARHRARLEHRVTLPFAALILIVAGQHRETADQWPAVPQRTQPHVDAEHEAIGGHRVQCGNQLLAETREIFLMIQ